MIVEFIQFGLSDIICGIGGRTNVAWLRQAAPAKGVDKLLFNK